MSRRRPTDPPAQEPRPHLLSERRHEGPEWLATADLETVVRADAGAPVHQRPGQRRRVIAVARCGLLVAVVSAISVPPTLSAAENGPPAAPVVRPECPPPQSSAQQTADEPSCTPGEDPPAPPAGEGDPGGEGDPAAPADPPAAEAPAGPAGDPAPPPAAAGAPAGDAGPPAAAAGPGEATAGKPAAEVAEPVRRSDGRRRAARGAEGKRTGKRRTAARRRVERRDRPDARPEATLAPAPAPAPVGFQAKPSPLAAPLFMLESVTVPRFLLRLYRQAGKRYGVPWEILAAINEIETDFGRNVAVSSAGATGWMQFMPATWAAYGVDADKDGTADPNNPSDAIHAAARYLRASGARRNLRTAIFAYNHADWYVESVLIRAERIGEERGRASRRLRRLMRRSQSRLEHRVLRDERIRIYTCGRQDIADHRIDRRVLITLELLADAGLHPTVTSLNCGHGYYTASGNVSHHSTGTAVDIAAINGVAIAPDTQGPGSITDATIRELLTLKGALRPDQIISLMKFEGRDNTLAMGDHADHIHVGFKPLHAGPQRPPPRFRFPGP